MVGNPGRLELIYGPAQRRQIHEHTRLLADPLSAPQLAERPQLLREVELIFSGWGAPKFHAELLDQAPNLRAVFYGAGSIRSLVTDAFWDRGIVITSSYRANAVPVAEFCLSQILYQLKNGHAIARDYRAHRARPGARDEMVHGGYGSRVGLISFGQIARLTRKLLRPIEVEVMVYCPFMTEDLAAEHDIVPATLEQVFAQCPVVSLHTPNLPETRGMIQAEHLRAIPAHGTFINTARGAVVDEPGMIEVLTERPDLTAVLDVTDPEPPAPDSPLWTLPNVVLTPHVAGSQGPECRRMGQYAVDEMKRFLRGQPLQHQITREQAKVLA
jgi:phosphoglycerate dehydrogenase-like enzyme